MPEIESQPIEPRQSLTTREKRGLDKNRWETRTIGARTIVLFPGDNIQKALDKLDDDNGGTIFLKAGVHKTRRSLIGRSGVRLQGEAESNTFLDFDSTPNNLSFAGTSTYAVGTITSITSGVVVTGSGTSWLANVTIDHQFFIDNVWYKISSIANDTTIILAEIYSGNATLPGSAYRTAKVLKDLDFVGLTIQNSTGTALSITDCRNTTFSNFATLTSAVGIAFNNVSEIAMDVCVYGGHTSDGIQMTNVGLLDIESTLAISNGGHGWKINNFILGTLGSCAASGNTGDGYNLTNTAASLIQVSGSSNGGKGLEVVSGNSSEGLLISGTFSDNTSDGIKLTVSCDDAEITDTDTSDNGGYGVNIAAATVTDTSLGLNSYNNNTAGAINDQGVGTVIVGASSGLSFKHFVREVVRMKNSSGAGVVEGDICVMNDDANGDAVTTTTGIANTAIRRGGGFMALETIANAAYGRFLRKGFTTKLKVDGTTDIAVGDALTTFTTAGISQVITAATQLHFAIALEAYTVNDSAGVIDAILIEPKTG